MKLVEILTQEEGADLAAEIESIRDLGFEHVAYAGMNPLAQTIHGHVTYGPDWKAFYAGNNLHENDPILLRAARSVAPVDWGRLRGGPGGEIFERARDYGLPEAGLTLPVRGPMADVGLLSVSAGVEAGEWRGLVGARLEQLHACAVRLHDRVMGTDPLTKILASPTLSGREREVLQWAAAGRTQDDTAAILSLSPRTVEAHLSSARTKLAALTTSQAVGRAIALGLVHPE